MARRGDGRRAAGEAGEEGEGLVVPVELLQQQEEAEVQAEEEEMKEMMETDEEAEAEEAEAVDDWDDQRTELGANDDSAGLYAVLGVDAGATDMEITQAYRSRAAIFHPDRNAGDTAAVQTMQELTTAHGVLGVPALRAAYDVAGMDGVRLVEQDLNSQDALVQHHVAEPARVRRRVALRARNSRDGKMRSRMRLRSKATISLSVDELFDRYHDSVARAVEAERAAELQRQLQESNGAEHHSSGPLSAFETQPPRHHQHHPQPQQQQQQQHFQQDQPPVFWFGQALMPRSMRVNQTVDVPLSHDVNWVSTAILTGTEKGKLSGAVESAVNMRMRLANSTARKTAPDFYSLGVTRVLHHDTMFLSVAARRALSERTAVDCKFTTALGPHRGPRQRDWAQLHQKRQSPMGGGVFTPTTMTVSLSRQLTRAADAEERGSNEGSGERSNNSNSNSNSNNTTSGSNSTLHVGCHIFPLERKAKPFFQLVSKRGGDSTLSAFSFSADARTRDMIGGMSYQWPLGPKRWSNGPVPAHSQERGQEQREQERQQGQQEEGQEEQRHARGNWSWLRCVQYVLATTTGQVSTRWSVNYLVRLIVATSGVLLEDTAVNTNLQSERALPSSQDRSSELAPQALPLGLSERHDRLCPASDDGDTADVQLVPDAVMRLIRRLPDVQQSWRSAWAAEGVDAWAWLSLAVPLLKSLSFDMVRVFGEVNKLSTSLSVQSNALAPGGSVLTGGRAPGGGSLDTASPVSAAASLWSSLALSCVFRLQRLDYVMEAPLHIGAAIDPARALFACGAAGIVSIMLSTMAVRIATAWFGAELPALPEHSGGGSNSQHCCSGDRGTRHRLPHQEQYNSMLRTAPVDPSRAWTSQQFQDAYSGALRQQRLMLRVAHRKRTQERATNGLVIRSAVYGTAVAIGRRRRHLAPQQQQFGGEGDEEREDVSSEEGRSTPPLWSAAITTDVELGETLSADADWDSGALDVTVVLQMCVNNGVLHLPASPKPRLLGFAPLSCGGQMCELRVRYEFGLEVFEAACTDLEPLVLPDPNALALGRRGLVS